MTKYTFEADIYLPEDADFSEDVEYSLYAKSAIDAHHRVLEELTQYVKHLDSFYGFNGKLKLHIRLVDVEETPHQ